MGQGASQGYERESEMNMPGKRYYGTDVPKTTGLHPDPNEHTPTPWTTDGDDILWWEEQREGAHVLIATIYQGNNDAAFIVRAVNAHDALLEALDKMKEFYSQLAVAKVKVPAALWASGAAAITLTDDALKLAKGET